MSNRKICVCGRERGKEPVIITITTCRHKHQPKKEDSCTFSGPLATSSPRTSGDTSSSPKEDNGKTSENEDKSAEKSKSSTDEKSSLKLDTESLNEKDKKSGKLAEEKTDTFYTTTNDQSATVYESINTGESTVTSDVTTDYTTATDVTADNTSAPVVTTGESTVADETADYSTISDVAVDQTTVASDQSTVASDQTTVASDITPDESTNLDDSTFNETDPNKSDVSQSGYSADDSTKLPDSTLNQSELTGYETAEDGEMSDSSQEQDDETKDPLVMYLIEASINTMPFLENLFWTKSKSMSNFSEDSCSQEDCSIEVFVLEKHSQFCRHHIDGIKNENYFYDGGILFETLGRVTLPNCCDDYKVNMSRSQKLASAYSQLKENFKKNSERNNYYENSLKNLNEFVKNKEFFENLNKNEEPLNLKLQKFMTIGDDIYQRKFKSSDVEELYFRKNLTFDKSVQFEEFYLNLNHPRSAKWYDIFLICLGLKDNEEIYNVENPNEKLLPKESSHLVTKYLKI